MTDEYSFNFQSSIESELKASLLIGRQLNLNEARRLAMAGDMAGLQEEILRQVGSEEELQRMNAIQRKSLAGALGVTVSELNKLASGELEVKNSDMKQNTKGPPVVKLNLISPSFDHWYKGKLASSVALNPSAVSHSFQPHNVRPSSLNFLFQLSISKKVFIFLAVWKKVFSQLVLLDVLLIKMHFLRKERA